MCLLLLGLISKHFSGLFDFNLSSLFDDSVQGIDQAGLVVFESQIDDIWVKSTLLKLISAPIRYK